MIGLGVVLLAAALAAASERTSGLLDPPDTPSGFVALLLINETPFPGERAWVSEADTKAAMLAILWVLHSRIEYIPPGYRQEQIAAVRSTDILDVITAGGVHGQCEGFHRDSSGRFVAVPRVHQRVDRLVALASKGEPGRFARLLEYAQSLARNYFADRPPDDPDAPDRYAGLRDVGRVPVTGRAYSWMTNTGGCKPGGDFVGIPDAKQGAAGGNRFFTLRRRN